MLVAAEHEFMANCADMEHQRMRTIFRPFRREEKARSVPCVRRWLRREWSHPMLILLPPTLPRLREGMARKLPQSRVYSADNWTDFMRAPSNR